MSEAAERFGNWLFRFRSWIPPLLLAVLLGALWRNGAGGLGLPPLPLAAGVAATIVGFAIRAAVIGTAAPGSSGRNTLVQVADHLNTTGLYSIVRHPLYLGNLFIWLGLALATAVWWTLLVTGLAFGAFYWGITIAEEAFLGRRFGAEYQQWAARTPRIVPRPAGWVRSRLPFSWKIALRQEYYGWFTVTLFFVVLEVAARFRDTGRLSLSTAWLVALGAITVFSTVLRTLQRRTTKLDVPGR